eukprot:scaffold21380_cov77-Phaeocystis_antarctica.AAC.3
MARLALKIWPPVHQTIRSRVHQIPRTRPRRHQWEQKEEVHPTISTRTTFTCLVLQQLGREKTTTVIRIGITNRPTTITCSFGQDYGRLPPGELHSPGHVS